MTTQVKRVVICQGDYRLGDVCNIRRPVPLSQPRRGVRYCHLVGGALWHATAAPPPPSPRTTWPAMSRRRSRAALVLEEMQAQSPPGMVTLCTLHGEVQRQCPKGRSGLDLSQPCHRCAVGLGTPQTLHSSQGKKSSPLEEGVVTVGHR